MTDNAQVVKLLQGIWGEMKALNGRVDRVREDLGARIDDTNRRLEEMRAEMRSGFDTLGRRLDNVLRGEHGKEHREFRRRLTRVERRLGLSEN